MKFSLRKKTALLIIINALILSGTAIIVSSSIIANIIDDQYRAKATDVADTVAAVVNADAVRQSMEAVKEIYDSTNDRVGSEEWGTPEFDEYIDKFSAVKEKEYFNEVLNEIRNIQNVNDVDCVYLLYVDVPTKAAIYIVDAALEDACPPGCFDPIYDINKGLLNDPEIGFPAYITNTDEYGWLVTAGVPIYDDGEVVAYSMVDISMDDIRAKQNSFIYTIIIVLLILTVITIIIAIVIVDHNVVKPINTLSEAAAKYCEEKDMSQAKFDFAGLDLHTGDEIETLSESMKQMERDINNNVSELLVTTEELTHTRMKADMMNELATKDALTGVRNKTSYDIEVQHLSEELSKGKTGFGIGMIDLNYLKKINDTYGHEKGNITIQKLCHIICATFVHSPVFRIGGDEFVVILENNDYENVKELVDSFNAIIDDLESDIGLEQWERVSAAIGYALYDSRRDTCVEDVFKRADGAMYIRKKQMKSK